MIAYFSFSFPCVSARNKQTDEVGPRTGTFIDFKQKSVVVRKWDPIAEGTLHVAYVHEQLYIH